MSCGGGNFCPGGGCDCSSSPIPTSLCQEGVFQTDAGPTGGMDFQIVFPTPMPGLPGQVRVLVTLGPNTVDPVNPCATFYVTGVTNTGFSLHTCQCFEGTVYWSACPNAATGTATATTICTQ